MKKSFVNVLIVSGLTLLSQLIGYLREMIFAYYLGTSMSLEAFQTAETVPLTFTQILISAVPLAFTPMLIREQKDKEEKLIHNAIFMFGIIMLFISIGVFSFSNVFVRILAPGFEGEKLLLTARIVTTLSPNILFLSLVAIYNSYLNAKKQFAIPALTALLLNICIIIMQLLTKANVKLVATGSVTGGALMFIVTSLYCRKHYGLKLDTKKVKIKSINEITKSIFPVCIISTFTSLNLVFDKFFASQLGGGAIAVLTYSYKIINLPVYLFVTSVTKVMLPDITRLLIENNHRKLAQLIRKIMAFCIAGGGVFVIIMYVMGEWIVEVLFGRGAFNESDIISTVAVLKVYAFGVSGMALNSFFQSISYAKGRYMEPFVPLLVQMLIYIVVCQVMLERWGLLAIVYGNVIASIMATVVWIVILDRKYNINIFQRMNIE